jgi:formylglycine-generating enzyme required for sulfatase activity/serine/threonine protein kinase
MPIATPCLSPEECRRLLRGHLPAGQVTTLTEHIAQCERCQETVRQLSADDSVVEALPGARAAELPRGKIVDVLIDVVCGLRSRAPAEHTPPPADTTESYPFLAPPQSEGEIGRLGVYRVRKVLGHGGMGIVFQAEDSQLRRYVALKVMKPTLADNAVYRQRFLREAQAAAAVRHDHIVTIYQVDQDREVPFLAMELLEGETLEARLQREGTVPPAEVLRVGREMAAGLVAAHDRDLIHRDIKPANIWLEGERGRVKILDFGLVRAVRGEERLTTPGAVAGTAGYMAPEQARGEEIDRRADLFSLGCVLYRMTVGELPFPGKDPMAVLRAVAVEQPRSPRKRNPKIPAALSAVIMQLLAKNRDERPANALAVVQVLAAIALPSPIQAPVRLKPRPTRRRWVVLSAAVVLVAALGMGISSFHLPRLLQPGSPKTPQVPDPAGIGGGSGKAPGGELVHQPPESSPPIPPKTPPEELAQKAEAILQKYCYRCHGQEGVIEGGFNYVLDPERLVAQQKVIPGDPDRSPLLRRIQSQKMPPEGEPRPGDPDVEVLRNWIKDGARPGRSVQAAREWIPETTILQWIEKDLQGLNARSHRFTRYFTITHLYNAGRGPDELQTYRHGLAKLINSLSWGRRIVLPQPIDKERTVFRIDLRDYYWGKKEWDLIVAEYPYRVTHDTTEARSCYVATQCQVPYLRADWFVAVAARPPLYHDLLQLPTTAGELEKRLGVDVEQDLRQDWVVRAAFNNSGVAHHNRLLERHEAAYGAYWKSYDFATDIGRKDVRSFPLGPGPDKESFQHDGGEIIFNLPNGLQAYLLVDDKGNRLDKGPLNIVVDKEAVRKGLNPEVVNGISCMACHVQGMNARDDQVREMTLRNRVIPAATRDTILALYPPRARFADLLHEDAERFRVAVEKTGSRLTSTDSVVALAGRYEGPADLNLVAAEAGMEPQVFQQALAEAPKLARTFGVLHDKGGTMSRRQLENGFADLVRELRLGDIYDPAAEEIRNSIGMRLRRIPAGKFLMGSLATDAPPHTEDERPRHEVTISQPFYIGVYEVTQKAYFEIMSRQPSDFSATGKARDRVAGQNTDNFPVDSVSWTDAKKFCKALSELEAEKKAGREYRLPTEAEWEYACRGRNHKDDRFNTGRTLSPDQANFDGGPGSKLDRTREVGLGEPNDFGLYDMHGNVAEWCEDVFEENYYTPGPVTDPKGPSDDGTQRVLRGGSWQDKEQSCRSAFRDHSLGSDFANHRFGFRVVCIIRPKAP